MIKISPSILSADFAKLGEQIERLNSSDVEMVHIDVMDGSFVPNITFGAPVMKCIRKYTDKIFDVHLMIEEPARYIEDFVKAGADIITVHYEADRHIDRTVNYIKSFGVKAGVALNPGTPVSVLENIINSVDMVLIMTVNPGFGGQKYIEYCSEKVKEVKALSEKRNKELMIQVDGGIDASNIKYVVECGANVIVAGSAVFKNDAIEENVQKLREALK
ncbi:MULTISPECIES: ribulose-phosphate 3-epimerase [Clostridium]|uniref:Ribulose-phosphate 3-epimerase n=1 Tax=Clostridium cadaveris TaxID=1529 RepID=A0A1I2J9E2_9CLOT|nr:ribulose-phosphate 3-epimerase [Clostridium cadaveris]MDU4951934.1 ribulose-phosphate 3-epimerase [Clostridium sp.]MDM8311102.1 ribulose-phosphate 3-epimerase [Clostridium cadaveris]MDY4947882.1 ribulose-phosphate 3-epimerase [Clostridium cadaveris]NME64180.1 ribulose-phosphate 3-epimerase [Clostridium cadaveris]PWL53488.1 MAG: ribulose-phosphate 3-epimerase [Clostridium cadaveris]